MEIADLKKKVEEYQARLAANAGKFVVFSETGPANMGLVEALVSTIEKQEQRIIALERKVGR
jgi:hypothetical protein